MAIKTPGNLTLSFNSNALAGYLNDTSIEAIVKELITTVLTDTGETKIPGLPSWNITVGGPWSSTLDGYLAPDAISPAMRTLVAVYGGVTLTWTASGSVGSFIANYKIVGNPDNPIAWTATLAVSGIPVRS